MKSTQQAKPSEFSQLSVVDKPGEEKISENKTIAEIIKKSTQDKKYYVIYNGPMKGVYDAWEKAAPFTHQSRIIHKGGTGIIRNIPTRAEIKEKKTVCRSNLRETLNIVLNWTEEKRAILGYYPIAKEQLTKLVIFPDASPSDTYQFFQYGLIDTILIFNDLKIISEFPAGFVDAVKRFKNMIDNVNPRDISLKFTNSQPIFNEEEECLVPVHQTSQHTSNVKEMKLKKERETLGRESLLFDKNREDHKCQLCVSEISEESNNEIGSTHMIKEEDSSSIHIKEEDSASEASLDIIA
ncbi:hypothetical protein Ahy_A08g037966 [Arachis hypogaea]|uniref:Uncharacterized protein n=1 Tax=Arachis hypogaea TaxID=3818 RepID=A0A445BSH4_ARAHY|nr:hypothetical protein Ahy_A08g037966 [Arachis hypogaea]